MSKAIKSRYDKALNKYHIDYHKLDAETIMSYRYDIYNRLNNSYELAIIIDTQMGSVSKPEAVSYSRTLEGLFPKYKIPYQINPFQVPSAKKIMGIPVGTKTVTHYKIVFFIEERSLTHSLFNDLLCEFDVQVGYRLLESQSVIFDSFLKGYISDINEPDYFGENFVDSRLFNKFLATEMLNGLG